MAPELGWPLRPEPGRISPPAIGAEDRMTTGSCLCGAVALEVAGPLPDPDACHCSQCRRQSGHYWASTDVPRDALTISGSENIRWYRSSERVRRGFCAICGSILFWDPIGRDKVAIG